MVVAVLGTGVEGDFSFVRDELNRIKDIPRNFDEELYKKLGVSSTVIVHWKEIGYIPSFYKLFCLLEEHKYILLYNDYMSILSGLMDEITKENEKIGVAVKEYYRREKEGYEWFIKSSKEYVYILSYSYDDGSGDNLICTCDYEAVKKCMHDEIENDEKDVIFQISRFPIIKSSSGEFEGIDITNPQGELVFDKFGQLKDVENINGYSYDPMSLLELTSPFIYMPHPFMKGDIVSFKFGEENIWGVVSHDGGEESFREIEKRGVTLDGSDFLIRLETIYEKDGKMVLGYDHISPLCLEKYSDEIDFGKRDIYSSLGVLRDIIMGKSTTISDLFYFMRI